MYVNYAGICSQSINILFDFGRTFCGYAFRSSFPNVSSNHNGAMHMFPNLLYVVNKFSNTRRRVIHPISSRRFEAPLRIESNKRRVCQIHVIERSSHTRPGCSKTSRGCVESYQWPSIVCESSSGDRRGE